MTTHLRGRISASQGCVSSPLQLGKLNDDAFSLSPGKIICNCWCMGDDHAGFRRNGMNCPGHTRITKESYDTIYRPKPSEEIQYF